MASGKCKSVMASRCGLTHLSTLCTDFLTSRRASSAILGPASLLVASFAVLRQRCLVDELLAQIAPLLRSDSMTSPVPILMYHQVSPRAHPGFEKYTVAVEKFAAQMRWLRYAGYCPTTLDDLLDARSGCRPLPPRPVVVTFDDGYRECVEHAVPIMAEHRFTATFYLVAGLMGSTSRWLARERGIELRLVDWQDARELLRAGFCCGSHTMLHPRLAELSPEACRDELEESRRRLEDRLASEVRHLALPYGSYDEAVRLAVTRAGYRSACSVRVGLSAPTDDRLALHRVPVTGQDSLLDFVCKLYTARAAPELLRAGVRSALRKLRAATA
jgi:peptidoglycan/xylan/chitin deacetylase (PgdA/CDA1 family)